MIKNLTVISVCILIFMLFLNIPPDKAYAQVGQLWETIVGNPQPEAPPIYDDEGNEQIDTGGGSLTQGEFLIPFRCSLKYFSETYALHSAYSIDLNRGDPGDDKGDPVYASADGVVIDIQDRNGQVTIRHGGGYMTLYAHMWPYYVREGSRVKAGQKIGEVNDRGAKPGAHHIHYNQCQNCSNVSECAWNPTSTYRGCRIKVKFKGYRDDPNSQFPYEGNKRFYYSKCY